MNKSDPFWRDISWLFLIVAMLPFSHAFAAAGGVADGGGGDDVALEFRLSANLAIRTIRNLDSLQTLKAHLNDLNNSLNQAKLIVVDTPLPVNYNGVVQDSVLRNTRSTSTIEINRARWNAASDERIREALSIHELLSLIGLESTGNYALSKEYLDLFSIVEGSLPSAGLPGQISESEYGPSSVVCQFSPRHGKQRLSLLVEEGARVRVNDDWYGYFETKSVSLSFDAGSTWMDLGTPQKYDHQIYPKSLYKGRGHASVELSLSSSAEQSKLGSETIINLNHESDEDRTGREIFSGQISGMIKGKQFLADPVRCLGSMIYSPETSDEEGN